MRIMLISYIICTFVASRVITLELNKEELRNTNGCYFVTQFSSNPTNRFILSELSFLAKVTKKVGSGGQSDSWRRRSGGIAAGVRGLNLAPSEMWKPAAMSWAASWGLPRNPCIIQG